MKPNKLRMAMKESEQVIEFLDNLVKFFDYCVLEVDRPDYRAYNVRGLVFHFFKRGGAWDLVGIFRQNDEIVFRKFGRFSLNPKEEAASMVEAIITEYEAPDCEPDCETSVGGWEVQP